VFTERHDVTPSFANAEQFDEFSTEFSGWNDEDYQCQRMTADQAPQHVCDAIPRKL
jgi:hypothetical protein